MTDELAREILLKLSDLKSTVSDLQADFSVVANNPKRKKAVPSRLR